MKQQPTVPFPANYNNLGPMARSAAESLHHARLARLNPTVPPIVTVDIPPRPIPGRQTVPGTGPVTLPRLQR